MDSPPNLEARPSDQPRQPSQNSGQQSNASYDASTAFGANQHISIDINLNGGNVHNRAESRIQNITRILGYVNRAIDKLERDPNVASPSYDQVNFDGSNDNSASGGLFADNIVTQSITEVGILLPDNQVIPPQPNSNFLNQLSQDITDFLFNGGQATAGSRQSSNATSTSSNATNQPASAGQPSLGTLIGSLTQGIIGGSLGNFTSMGIPTSVNISSSSNAQPTSISSPASTNSSDSGQRPASGRSAEQTHSTNGSTARNQSGGTASSSTTPSTRRRVTWSEFADVLKNVQRTQERFTPHFNSFQQSLLQRHGSLSASQAEEEQVKYRLIARCMHHLAHVWHMCSDIHINYTHQQDQTIQVFVPLMRRPTYHPPATAEIVMTTGSINLGGGLLPTSMTSGSATNNQSNANAAATNTSSSNTSAGINISNANARHRLSELRERRVRNETTMNASSLPNNFATSSINVQTESPISSGNNSQTATINSNGRRESPWFVFSNQAPAPAQQSGATSSERTASSASDRVSETRSGNMFQNMFGASLPNLASNNLAANGQVNSNTSVISLTTIQPTTVIVSRSRNASGNQPQASNNGSQQSAINSLRDLFNLGSRPSTAQQPAAGQRTDADRESSASNNGSNQNASRNPNQQQQPSSSFFRMSPITQTNQRPRQAAGNSIAPGFPYSYIYNFDPHLPCSSTWIIPEIRFVLF